MAEQRDVPRETNPLVIALAEVAVAVVARRREAEERRRTIRVASTNHHPKGEAA